MSAVRVRQATSPADWHRIVELELRVWGLREIDAVPYHVLALSVHNGGLLLIAEDPTAGDRVVGFAVAFPARREGVWVLWSHITGVDPAYQGRGIGRRLKLTQQEWTSKNGFPAIGWTFDPLQAANANFNLNVLGAEGVAYHHDFYGPMRDALNSFDLPSDRLEARWEVAAQPTAPRSPSGDGPVWFLVDVREGLPQLVADIPSGAGRVAIRVPQHQGGADVEGWQTALRVAFQMALGAGYRACGFVRDGGYPYYVLSR